jgi:drug/metabolite transporter (DMT)-like permease
LHFQGELAALGTALCWAAGSNFFAGAGRRFGAVRLNRLRLTIGAAFLVTALLVTRGAPVPLWATPRQVAILAASGLLGFVFGDYFYFRSLVRLGPGRGTLLSSLSPLFTALIAWPLLGEHPGRFAALGMAMTVAGVVWVMWEHTRYEASLAAAGPAAAAAPPGAAMDAMHGTLAAGTIAGVLGALGQSCGYVLSKLALASGLDPLSATVIRILSAGVAVWTLALLARDARGTLGVLQDRRGAGLMVGGAFFGPFLGVTLSLTALHYIEAGVAASIAATYPLFTILLSARFHGERITPRMIGGTLLAVLGVVVLFLRAR